MTERQFRQLTEGLRTLGQPPGFDFERAVDEALAAYSAARLTEGFSFSAWLAAFLVSQS